MKKEWAEIQVLNGWRETVNPSEITTIIKIRMCV